MADEKKTPYFFDCRKRSLKTWLRDRGPNNQPFTDKCICLEAVLFGHPKVEKYRLLHKRRKR
jgi:hypothetical protein